MKDSNNKAIELIKVIYFYPKALAVFIDTSIKQLAIFGKDIPDGCSRDAIASILTSDSFLEPFAEKIKTLFAEEEMDSLLEIYQSKLMKKFLRQSENLFTPLYKEATKQIENMISP